MATQFPSKLETLANIAIIISSAVLITVLVRDGFFARQQKHTPVVSNTMRPGAHIPLFDSRRADGSQTVLLALSSNCRECAEGAAFYQVLARSLQNRRSILLVALLPDPPADAGDYFTEMGISVTNVRHVDFFSLGIRRTPTIAIVNSKGVVTDVWVGALAPPMQMEVLRRLGIDQTS